MVNLLNYFINEKKLLIVELTKIHGIGFFQSKQLFQELGFCKTMRVSDTTQSDLEEISNWIQSNLKLLGADLQRYDLLNIKHLVENKSYRGYRHLRKLPVNGQRSRTNRKTQRRLGKIRNLQLN